MASEKSLKKLKKKADTLFSSYARRLRADEDGYVTCVTSGKVFHWKDVDAGHFISRSRNRTRYEIDNVWPQSREDNRFKNGEPRLFRDFLIREIGEERVVELEKNSLEPYKYSVGELEGLIDSLKESLNGL